MMTDQKKPPFTVPTNCDAEWNPTCPDCGCPQSEITHSYPPMNGKRRRRRICDNCGLPFYTLQPAEITE